MNTQQAGRWGLNSNQPRYCQDTGMKVKGKCWAQLKDPEGNRQKNPLNHCQQRGPTERWERIKGNKPFPKWGFHVPQRGRKWSQEVITTKQNLEQCLHTRGKGSPKLGSSAEKKQQLNEQCSVRRKFSCWEGKKSCVGGGRRDGSVIMNFVHS